VLFQPSSIQAEVQTLDTVPLAGVGARGAALLLSGQNGGDIEGAVIWTSPTMQPDEDLVDLRFYVEVEGQGLLESSTGGRTPLEVFGYVVDGTGTVVAHISEGILIDEGPQMERVRSGGLKFVGAMSAPPGLYSFRVLIRNYQTGRFFLARRDLDVRVSERTEPLLLPPVIVDAVQRWVMAPGQTVDLETARSELPGTSGLPAAMPTWRSDQPLQAIVTGSELGGNLRLSAQLIDHLGRRVLDPTVQIEETLVSRGTVASYRIAVTAPDVPPGSYRFVLSVTDNDSGASVFRSLPVVIHEADTDLAWTDPETPRFSTAKPIADVPGRRLDDEIESEAIRAAYLDVLGLWSRGEAVAARRALAAIEHPLESSSNARVWRQLITTERLTALSLAKEQPASLMAIAMLHRDMYGWYRARSEPQLARHSWQMSSMMARVIPRFVDGDFGVAFGESLLVDLAGSLARSGQPRPAHELLDAALIVSPESAPALLGVGALLERTGSPEMAIEHFERLYEAHPELAEGQLRLALTQWRTGAERPAEDHLRALIAPETPTWVRTLAYQELARVLTESGRLDEAQRILVQGIDTLAESQRLQIQLAHLLDLAGQPSRAAAVAEGLQALGSRQGTSPRYRYSAWPDLEGDRILTTLLEGRQTGLESLAAALP
jgi:tetratricopeptide (TPR) repeat protein